MRELVRNGISDDRGNSGVWSNLNGFPSPTGASGPILRLGERRDGSGPRSERRGCRRDNETSIEIAAGQLLDEKARHARLSCARIVRQQETQRLTRQHSLPDRRDLMAPAARRTMSGPRATGSNKCARRMRCASETKTEQAAIETRGTAGFDDFEALLVVPVQQLVRDSAGRSFIC